MSTVATWTFQFAFFSVLLAFFVGLFLAVTLNNEKVRFQKVYRSIYIIPYAIPGFISILVFRGLLNPDFGLINDWLDPIYQLLNIEPVNQVQSIVFNKKIFESLQRIGVLEFENKTNAPFEDKTAALELASVLNHLIGSIFNN